MRVRWQNAQGRAAPLREVAGRGIDTASMRSRDVALAVAAGLGLADASIVTLALPDILSDLNTSVEGVAAVIGVYTVVLAIALVPFERAASAFSARAIGAGGFALFAVASAACAGAHDLTGLLIARCAQAVGAAGGLATVFDLLGGAGPGRRLWLGAAVFATALGPAAGGALTGGLGRPGGRRLPRPG